MQLFFTRVIIKIMETCRMFMRMLQLLSCQIAIKGFITRLPCIVHGKLNLIESRYNNGSIIRQLTSLKQHECAITCVGDALCVMVNYKKDGTVCELVSSTDGSEIQSNEWNVVRSDTESDKRIGQICEQINPCASDEYCRDVCGENNKHTYACLGLTNNAARKGILSQSSVIPGDIHSPCDICDGDYSTIIHTDFGPVNWVKLDLGFVYRANVIIVHNRMDCCQERIVGYTLMVGTTSNEADYQQIAVLTSDFVQVFQLKIFLRYLYISKTPGNEYLNLSEVEVFV